MRMSENEFYYFEPITSCVYLIQCENCLYVLTHDLNTIPARGVINLTLEFSNSTANHEIIGSKRFAGWRRRVYRLEETTAPEDASCVETEG